VLLVHDPDHLVARDSESRTARDSGGRSQAQTRDGCECFLPDKVLRCETRDGGFFAPLETTVSFARPFWRKKTESAGSPWEKKFS